MSVNIWVVSGDQLLIQPVSNSTHDHNLPNDLEMEKEHEKPDLLQITEMKDEPEYQQIKKEHVEFDNFNNMKSVVKQEADTFTVCAGYDDTFQSKPELLQMIEVKEETKPEQIKEEMEELETFQVKQEEEELCSHQDEDQLLVNQEAIRENLIYDKKDLSEPNSDQIHSSNSPEAED
ncbi:uncharacterized protein LOC103149996 isoform X2 [Poecilia formosa]|uniref:uncharacterized protein LOC103149996 isoform X2 n=1 Tax=Poecilia formosa TaxID=48698 RepID=UPI0004439C7E|nr:PREDICTED: uncharacterized protein LOC103149996 isoform X2 [Poecilia formosa]XP_007569471.1 PREDICTED: uncharacterized protein LOC103149996 isoform X2 [Poecilia formosa]XP_016535877.1 PREDICTED: uncharacterized protein LOC103149996 isoform X2 [Poecilia formosa]